MEKENKKKKTTKVETKSKKVEKKVEKKEKEEKVEKTKKEGFLKSVWHEMKKVTWPSKKHMVKYSIATIILIIFFTLYFLGIEAVFAWIKEVVKNVF